MSYYASVAQVEQVMQNLAAQFGPRSTIVARRIALAHPTHENRQTSALQISTQPGAGKKTVLILGGVHANEFGSCEIALNLATMLLKAYSMKAGLSFGAKTFTAQQIQSLLAARDVLVFPLVNPDGRQFVTDQASANESDWRKNRRSFGAGIGVDINRNFDFVFDLDLFAPGSAPVASTQASSVNYQGPQAESEAETKNVVSLLNALPQVGWLIDLHSAGLSFTYSWNHDEIQTISSATNFRSPGAQGKMGTPGPANYREFLDAKELADMQRLAARFAADAVAVRQTPFDVGPAYWHSPYPGTSHDYAYSRHLVDPTKSRTLGFICEWGDLNQHPAWSEMERIIEEVTAGLIGFCLETI